MPSYRLKHITRYSYATPVGDCTNQIILYPVQDDWQQLSKHEIAITHNPLVELFTDYFGNTIGMFTIVQAHRELTITSIAEVITLPVPLPVDDMPAAHQWEQLASIRQHIPYMDFLQQENFTAQHELKKAISTVCSMDKTPFQNAVDLSAFVYNNFEYRKGVTSIETKVDEIWALKAGVCQDFAHLLLQILRIIGLPARYVSGYICPKEQELRGEGATHAWIEAYIPNHGWIGLDPTNNCIVSDGHIRLAIGRNFTDCTPVKGTYKGSSEHRLEVSVVIENGTARTATSKQENETIFTYQATNPSVSGNSYRFYMEQMQQQQ